MKKRAYMYKKNTKMYLLQNQKFFGYTFPVHRVVPLVIMTTWLWEDSRVNLCCLAKCWWATHQEKKTLIKPGNITGQCWRQITPPPPLHLQNQIDLLSLPLFSPLWSPFVAQSNWAHLFPRQISSTYQLNTSLLFLQFHNCFWNNDSNEVSLFWPLFLGELLVDQLLEYSY